MTHDSSSAYQRWKAAFDRHAEDVGFRRARFQAVARLLVGMVRSRGTPAGVPNHAAGRATIPVKDIVGVVDRNGRAMRGLPWLPRGAAPTWQILFHRDADSFPALPVKPGPGGWYLADAAGSVLFLEVMRARGLRDLNVVIATEGAEQSPEQAGPPAEPCDAVERAAS